MYRSNFARTADTRFPSRTNTSTTSGIPSSANACVTHLPQIAAMADTHFVISKSEREGRTYTQVTPLKRQGRAEEIARLHGGDNITLLTIASAEEQLSACDEYKKRVKK